MYCVKISSIALSLSADAFTLVDVKEFFPARMEQGKVLVRSGAAREFRRRHAILLFAIFPTAFSYDKYHYRET